jgi:hypothetical protein
MSGSRLRKYASQPPKDGKRAEIVDDQVKEKSSKVIQDDSRTIRSLATLSIISEFDAGSVSYWIPLV